MARIVAPVKRSKDDVIIYPKTVVEAVYDFKNNKSLGETLLNLNNKIITLESKVDNERNFKGYYSKIGDFPLTGNKGDYVLLDIPNKDAVLYIWDYTDAKWIETGSIVQATKINNVTGDPATGEFNLTLDNFPDIKSKIETLESNVSTLSGKLNDDESDIESLQNTALLYKGTFSTSTSYYKNNVVVYEKQMYRAKKDFESSMTPKDDTENWESLGLFDGNYNDLINTPSLDGYATKEYVNTNGGKIDNIYVEGEQTPLTITNKAVTIPSPTNKEDKVSVQIDNWYSTYNGVNNDRNITFLNANGTRQYIDYLAPGKEANHGDSKSYNPSSPASTPDAALFIQNLVGYSQVYEVPRFPLADNKWAKISNFDQSGLWFDYIEEDTLIIQRIYFDASAYKFKKLFRGSLSMVYTQSEMNNKLNEVLPTIEEYNSNN